MNFLFSFLLSFATAFSSPDGKLVVKIEQTSEPKLLYSVEYCGQQMLSPFRVGTRRQFQGLQLPDFQEPDN